MTKTTQAEALLEVARAIRYHAELTSGQSPKADNDTVTLTREQWEDAKARVIASVSEDAAIKSTPTNGDHPKPDVEETVPLPAGTPDLEAVLRGTG